jgi:hypothetical protein
MPVDNADSEQDDEMQKDDVDQLTEALQILHQLDTALNTVGQQPAGGLEIDS